MATFLNTGVLGQQVGGTLGTAGLRGEFRSFRDEVLASKKSTSHKARRTTQRQAEKASVAKQRATQSAQSKETTGIAEGVDTSDVAGTSAAQGQQGVAKTDVAPEFKYTEETGRFASQFLGWQSHIGGKPANDINKGAGQTQGYLGDLIRAAEATGDQNLIAAVGGITGILGENNISGNNVGQAKAATQAAAATIRSSLDIDRVSADMKAKGITFAPLAPPKAKAPKAGTQARTQLSFNAGRRRSGAFVAGEAE